jgi:ArsR family transcriptional regulator
MGFALDVPAGEWRRVMQGFVGAGGSTNNRPTTHRPVDATTQQRDTREHNVVDIDDRRRRSDSAAGVAPTTSSTNPGRALHHPDVATPTVRDARNRQQLRAYFDFAERSAALASPTRVQLAVLLCESPSEGECGRTLALSVGLSETTVSHHLRLLRHVGLIESHRRGISVYHVPTEELLNLCHSLTTTELPRDAESGQSAASPSVPPVGGHGLDGSSDVQLSNIFGPQLFSR